MKNKRDLQNELTQAKLKVLHLEKDLTAIKDFSPWSKSIPEKKTKRLPQTDQRIQELSFQIQELKNSTRFTKMVELENEVSVYYREYSRLKVL